MSERFYTPTSLDADTVTLTDAEAKHLARVVRKKVGDEVALFDGQGREALAQIQSIAPRTVELRIISRSEPEPEPQISIVLATAVPKGDRFRFLIEKVTELGVDRLIPLSTTRSVVDPRESKLDRMRQAVIEACKQCGRNRLMNVDPVTMWSDFIAQRKAESIPWLIADRSGTQFVDSTSIPSTRTVTLAIGPEGGFTDEELEAAKSHGATRIRLANHTLRTETAAITAAALLQAITRSSGGRD